MAICSLIIDWSYKNDLFYYQIFNTPIEILKSHRIGMKQQEFQHMFSVNEAIRKEQLIASSVLDNSGDLIEYKSFGEEINAAFEKEYGYSFYQLKLFTEGLREYSKSCSSCKSSCFITAGKKSCFFTVPEKVLCKDVSFASR